MDLKRVNDNQTTVIRNESTVPFIAFKALESTQLVKHGFSTRLGGVSEGFLSTLNLGFGRGESDENVMENLKRIGKSIGFDYRRLVTTNQTHTTNIRVVTEEDAGKGIVIPRDYSDIDGLITNVVNLPLITYYADCVPLYFLDPVNKAIGLSHSGWRGTVGKIGAKTARLMGENYGTKPSDIICCIGPSICMDCYEVSSDVADEFMSAFGIEPSGIPFYVPGQKMPDSILYRKESGKYQLDLWEACRKGLLEAGVMAENIHVTDLCTSCNKEVLYSHRASNGKRGSLAAFLMLSDNN